MRACDQTQRQRDGELYQIVVLPSLWMGSQDQTPSLKFLKIVLNDIEYVWSLCFVAENGQEREKAKQKKQS